MSVPVRRATANVLTAVHPLEPRLLLASAAVNWDGDYVSANRDWQRTRAFSVVDYDGDGADDSVVRAAFSDSTPLNPSTSYTITGFNSGRFYGGAEFYRLDATASFTTNNYGVQNANAADGGDTAAFGQTNGSNRRQFLATLWKKADFLDAGLASAAGVKFDSGSSVSVDVNTNTSNHHSWRILLQNGSQYYLSSVSNTGDATVDATALANATWAAYNPTATDMRPTATGAAALSYTVASSSFTDIRAIGLYAESVGTSGVGDRVFKFESFVANLGTVPQVPAAPSGVAVTASGKSAVGVGWTDNSANEAGFRVERRASGTTAWLPVATVPADTTALADTGLAAGTTYEYRVTAFNGNGDSAAATGSGATQAGTANAFGTPLASSVVGSAGYADAVRGAVILSDGTQVIAGNFATTAFAGVAPTYLAGATSTSTAAVAKLSRDGSVVLAVARLPGTVWDLSGDAADGIYVALGTAGAAKLNTSLTGVLWQTTTHQGDRIDSAPNGDVAVLDGTYTSAAQDTPSGAGTIYVYNATGTLQASFAGWNRTYDVAIDEDTQSVFTTGYKQTNGPSGNPVQIAYLRSQDYAGVQRWKGYDWTGAQVDDPAAGGTGPTNNMADTRGLRLDVGADEKLYVAYQSAGGNHIFRYDPFNLFQTSSIVGGDQYHSFANSKSEHKTVFARYDTATGAVLRTQQLTARLATGAANAFNLNAGGDIQADAAGRVYILGQSGSGGGTNNTLLGLPYTFNPVPSTEYGGGPSLVVMSADFTTRLFVGRTTSNGTGYALAVRNLAGESFARVAFGGTTPQAVWSQNAIQPLDTDTTTSDGFLGLLLEG